MTLGTLTEEKDRRLGIGVRLMAGTAFALYGFVAGHSPYLIAAVVIALLALDVADPFTLKNFFLVYTVFLFGIGGSSLYPGATGLPRDLLIYIGVFLWAYMLSSRTGRNVAVPNPVSIPTDLSKIELLLKSIVACNLLLLVPQLLTYGPGGFYGGQALADVIGTYGTESLSGGAIIIVREILTTLTIAAVVLYVQGCLESGSRIKYRLLVVVLLVAPLLALQRALLLLGAALLLTIRACENRFRRAVQSEHRRHPGGTVMAVITVMLAIVVAAGIGGLRANRDRGAEGESPFSGTVLGDVLQGEFGPIIAYRDIREEIEVLGYRYGSNIALPLLTRVVPRAWLPSKPVTSAGYYMTKIRPGEFEGGYALAPSIFGVMFLNFGIMGCLLACIILGGVSARLDRAYRSVQLSRFPWFLIFFANFYSLLREDLANSLFRLLLTLGVYLFLRHAFSLSPVAVPTRSEAETVA